MNAFNRLFAVVMALLISLLAIGGLLALLGVIESDTFAAGGFLSDVVSRLARLSGAARVTAFLVAAAVLVMGWVLLLVELLSLRSVAHLFEVERNDSGRIVVEPAGVCRLMERVAMSLPGAVACRATVTEESGAVTGRCVLSTTSDSAVKGLAVDAQREIRRAVSQQIGIDLADLEIRVRITDEPSPAPKRTVE